MATHCDPVRWDEARVIVLTDFLSNFAGTERYTATVSNALADCGVRVEVFVAEPIRDNTWRDLLAARGIPVSAPASAAAAAGWWAAFRERIAASPPDLLLANPMGEALVCLLSGVPPRCPLPPVIGVEYNTPGPAVAHWYPPSLAGLLERVTAVITTCDASRAGVLLYFGYRGPTYVVPHLVPPPLPCPVPAEPRHHLGLIARLSPEKGIDYALGAVALLRREGTATELSIYGAGRDADRVVELACCLGIKSLVRLHGTFHPVKELDDIASRHAVWLQPSLFESVPTSLLELLARGRTVIATTVGGVPDEFEGQPGSGELLVPPADSRALADRVRTVVEHAAHFDSITSGLRDRVLARHAPSAVVPQLLAVLRRHTHAAPALLSALPNTQAAMQ